MLLFSYDLCCPLLSGLSILDLQSSQLLSESSVVQLVQLLDLKQKHSEEQLYNAYEDESESGQELGGHKGHIMITMMLKLSKNLRQCVL